MSNQNGDRDAAQAPYAMRGPAEPQEYVAWQEDEPHDGRRLTGVVPLDAGLAPSDLVALLKALADLPLGDCFRRLIDLGWAPIPSPALAKLCRKLLIPVIETREFVRMPRMGAAGRVYWPLWFVPAPSLLDVAMNAEHEGAALDAEMLREIASVLDAEKPSAQVLSLLLELPAVRHRPGRVLPLVLLGQVAEQEGTLHPEPWDDRRRARVSANIICRWANPIVAQPRRPTR